MQVKDDETRTNLIINHIPPNISDEDLRRLFAEMGEIKNHRIMKNLQTGRSLGFGFVDFRNVQDACKAILRLNNYQIQNRRLKVAYAQPPGGEDSNGKESNIYIQNLPLSISEDTLVELFSQFGTIEQKLIFKDKGTGMPKGVAFVRYATPEGASEAISGMNQQSIEGSSQPLLVKIAKDNANQKMDPKEKEAYQRGYRDAMAKMAGRGRGFASVHGGHQNGYGSMDSYDYTPMGATRSFGGMDSGMSDFSTPAGKMGMDRSNNRYNPIGGGSGYGATSFGGSFASPPSYSDYGGGMGRGYPGGGRGGMGNRLAGGGSRL